MPSSQTVLPVVSRTLAALFGGYVFTYAFSACMARLLPLDRVDALVVASLPVFVVYTLAILWSFSVASLWRAWLGVPLSVPLLAVGFWPQLLERLA